jgi:hypothetical protein
MYGRVDWYIGASILEKLAASVFRVIQTTLSGVPRRWRQQVPLKRRCAWRCIPEYRNFYRRCYETLVSRMLRRCRGDRNSYVDLPQSGKIFVMTYFGKKLLPDAGNMWG